MQLTEGESPEMMNGGEGGKLSDAAVVLIIFMTFSF